MAVSHSRTGNWVGHIVWHVCILPLVSLRCTGFSWRALASLGIKLDSFKTATSSSVSIGALRRMSSVLKAAISPFLAIFSKASVERRGLESLIAGRFSYHY